MRHYYGAWGDMLGVNPTNPLMNLKEAA